ncbi:hypothetical protein CsSME_00042044 [Camellia sinensis var. sinensis]
MGRSSSELLGARAAETGAQATTKQNGLRLLAANGCSILSIFVDGIVDHYKAQLVAKGFTQVPSKDFGDTFAPVAKLTSIRLLISLVASHSWPLHQLDVKNAFLHGDLLETIYMDSPPGFRAEGE